MKPFLRDRCRCHSHCCFTRGRAPASAMVTNAIFLPIGIVCVAGPERIDQIAIVPAAGIFVPDEERDGCTGGLAFEDTGKDLDRIGFLPLRDVARGAWFASVEIPLDILDGKSQTGWTAIYDTADRGTMALAERRDGKNVTERIACHGADDSSLLDKVQLDAQFF